MAPVRPFHHILPHSAELVHHSARSPLPFLAPNNVIFTVHHPRHTRRDVSWNSREHRKQRYRAASPRSGRSRHVRGVWSKIAQMSRLEYWNVSWWVAVLFTLGSIVWVINGFLVFMPFVTSVAMDPVGTGWSAWVGATIFTIGSILLILEAWNRDDTAGFALAIEHALAIHSHRRDEEALKGSSDNGSPSNAESKPHWIWWSNDRKYWHEIGFVAGFCQLCGATIFWISGFTGLPEILSVLQTNTANLDGAFWTPQVIGGSGFIISSALYMLETQKRWYSPNPTSLGWQIGFWNFIGGVGFTLCGAFGYSTKSGLMYQSALSTFWGSWAFLIGSLIQWYEAVNPVQASV